jgi:E3 SUMO-protein ligase RanBP2
VFGNSQKTTKVLNESTEEKHGNESTEFEPTAEFTPVIPLPDLVEVKTGEEGETVLYEERSKLLR